MATVTYLGTSYPCATAYKGADFVHLVDANGCMIAAFDGITEFDDFSITDGNWAALPADNDSYLAVIKDDGTIGKGGHRCCDVLAKSGGTIDGNITATSDTTTRFFSCDVGSYDVRLLANTAGNRGLYDNVTETWLLKKDSSNNVTLNGFASAFGSDAIKQVSTSVTTSQIAKGGYLSQQTTKATAVDGYEPFAVISVQSNSSYVLPYYYFLSNITSRTIGYSIRNLNTSEAVTPQLTFHVLYRKTTV